MNLCPATGCPQKVPNHMFACRTHWFQLPRDLRSAIWTAWRKRDLDAHAVATADAVEFYASVGDRP